MFYDDDDTPVKSVPTGRASTPAHNNRYAYNNGNEDELELPGSVSPAASPSRPTTSSGTRTMRASRAAEQLAAKRKERSTMGMVVANESISRPATPSGPRPPTAAAPSSPSLNQSNNDMRKSVLGLQPIPHATSVNNLNTIQQGQPLTRTSAADTISVSISSESAGNHHLPQEQHRGERELTEAERELLKRGISPTFDPNADKPLVRTPNIDFSDVRSFLLRPQPKGGMVQCKVYREKSGLDRIYPHYTLVLEDSNAFLLAARKRKKSKSSNYLVSLDKNDLSRDSPNFMGKLRSNFVGTEFVMYDKGNAPNPDGSSVEGDVRQELGVILYGPNILGFKGPRKMSVLIPALKDENTRVTWRPAQQADTLLERFKEGNHSNMVVLQNKSPEWKDGAFVLNFQNRVKVASVKNFQLVHPDDPDYIIMQFGRVADDVFTMDFQYPLCMLQAFSIVLSSFDNKIACE